jgi:hypothetical protein
VNQSDILKLLLSTTTPRLFEAVRQAKPHKNRLSSTLKGSNTPPVEARVLSKTVNSPMYSNTTSNVYVTIESPVFRNRGDMDYLVDRLKRMGMA